MSKMVCVLWVVLMAVSVIAQDTPQDLESADGLEEFSGAEIIIRLQKFVSTDQQRLIQLRSRSTELTQEIEKLTTQFNSLDARRQRTNTEEQNANQEWENIRTTLDLHLRSRQAIEQQIQVIENKIDKQKEVVDYLTLGVVPEDGDSVQMVEETIFQTDTASLKEGPKLQDRSVLEAIEKLNSLKKELYLRRHSLNLVEQLIRFNREDLKLAQIIADASGKLLSLYQEQGIAGTDKRNAISERYSQDTSLLTTLDRRINNLDNVLTPLVKAVNEAEQEVEAANEHLEFLRSPLAPHQISYWLKYNLPRIAIIIGILILIGIIARWITRLVLDKLKKRRIAEERLERIETLKLASTSIITILLVFIGVLVLLSEFGVDLTVVLGGAALFSLVIAFGAQSLVKDYFAGFMILLENQYRVGNVVKINNTSGTVENMSLRLTLLRDLQGVAHFIPHGQVTEVSNLTHGWAQVTFDIGVSYNQNVDQVMEVLIGLAEEMKEDEKYGSMIMGDPAMLGVDAFAESAIIIKFLVKTRPLQQWTVKRELLRRIKNRFDELGIEIPFPHLTVYHRGPEKPLDPPAIK